MNIQPKYCSLFAWALFLTLSLTPAGADVPEPATPGLLAPPRQVPQEKVLPGPVQEPRIHFNLSQVLERTLSQAPSLEEGLARLRQRSHEIDEAYTLVNPKASFQSQYQRIEPPLSFPGGPVIQPADNYSFALTLSQPIYTFGRLRYSTLAAKLSRRSEQETYLRTLQELISGAADLYIRALLANDAVTIAEDQLAAQKANLKTSTLLAEQGVVARFDVLRTGAATSEAEQDLIEAKTSRELAIKQLKSVLNLNFQQPIDLQKLELTAPPQLDLEEKKTRVLEQRSDLRALRWAVEAARARVHLARSENSPSLSIQNQTVNRNATGLSPGTQNTTSLVFSIPLSDGGASKARALQAEAQVDQMLAQLENRERQVMLEVEEAYARLQDRWSSIQVTENNVSQAEEAARIAKLRYQNGLSTSVELLQAQADLSRARYSLNQAQASYHQALWQWYRVGGEEFPVEVPLPPEVRERLETARLESSGRSTLRIRAEQ